MIKTTNAATRFAKTLPDRAALETAVCEVYAYLARKTCWLTGEQGLWTAMTHTERPVDEVFYDLVQGARELGLSFKAIEDTRFACSLSAMYDFAASAILPQRVEPLHEQSIHTWVAAEVRDLVNSGLLDFADDGAILRKEVGKLNQVVSLAHARSVLERDHGDFNGSSYLAFASMTPLEQVAKDEGALTIQQVALLAGMEEMSVRAAANPKRTTPLPTVSVKGCTLVRAADARAWLKAKNRYQPLVWEHAARPFDLESAQPMTLDRLWAGLLRATGEAVLAQGEASFTQQCAAIPVAFKHEGEEPALEYTRANLRDEEWVARLAALLGLNPKLLVLRAREAVARADIDDIDEMLKRLDIE